MRVVSRIVVTELEPDPDNPEPWGVEYVVDGVSERMRHDSKRAAQRHVANLLREAPGQEVLTINRRG